MTSLLARFDEKVARQPDKAALVFADAGGNWQTVTYRQLWERSQELTRGLASYNIRPGSRAVLMIPPSVDFFALAFALLRLGIVAVLVDPGIGLRNVTRCLAQAEPEIFLGSLLTHGLRMLFGWGKPTLRLKLSLSDIQRASQKQPPDLQPPALTTDGEMAVIFTSGSTGLPKGAVYTQANFAAQVAMLEKTLNLSGDEVDLPAFPIFALIDCLLGVTAVIPDIRFPRPAKVDPRRIIPAIQRQQVDTMFASPVMLARLARYGAEKQEKLPSLRRIITAGAPAPVPVLEQFTRLLSDKAQLWGVYGSTETLPVTLVNSKEILAETRFLSEQGAGVCIGYPVEGAEVRIVQISDDPLPAWNESLRLPAGQIGEIAVKGDAVTSGYVGKADYSRLSKIRDTDGQIIHRMGDVGYFDKQGRLWYCGRKSHRVILADGQTLFTEQIEGIFNAHPLVYRSALVGTERAGRVEPVLWVELEPSAKGADKSRLRAELWQLAADKPAAQPIHTILFHPDFPTDVRHNSKIIREKLARLAQRKLT
jgi:acyl-CoA synthetase (AMP-forming)/AMP-acid ligase II